MNVIIAVSHILGALIALFAFESAVLALSAWELKRNKKIAEEEISLALGIPAERLSDVENVSEVFKFNANRFSPDLFRNRLSDMCGWVQLVWGWLARILGVGVFLGVIWYSFTDSAQNAIYVWWVIAIAFFFSITSVVFGFICKLVTGRFPGQARQARKQLAQYINNQGAELAE